VPDDVMARLERMLEFVLHYTRPDGAVPLFGDCDDGRLHRLKAWATPEREWVDHRHLLAIGAVVFRRDDFGRAAADQWEEAFWLLGGQAVRFKEALDARPAPTPAPASRAFRSAGVYVMRAGDAYAAVDAGANGQGGNGGHAHNDTFSFEFACGGRAWVIDPGTYLYTADFGARNLFRSSRYHNVLVLDGQEINRIDPRELFAMPDDARPEVTAWESSPERDLLVGRHHGYERLAVPASVTRTFRFEKTTGGLVVLDDVRMAGRHAFHFDLHLAPATIRIEGGIAWIEAPGSEWGVGVSVASPAASVRLSASTGWSSPSYGSRRESPVLNIEGEFDDSLQLAVVLVPYRVAARTPPGELSGIAERMVAACRRETPPLATTQDHFSVALVGPYPPPYGGVSVHIKRLQRRLAALRIPSLVYCQPANGEVHEDHVIHAAFKFSWHAWIPEHGWRCDADIVHFHDGWYWAPAAWLMLLRGKSVVLTIHDQEAGTVGWRRASWLERRACAWLFRHPRAWWVGVSGEVERQLIEKGVPAARITVAPAYIPARDDADVSSLPAYVRDFLGAHSPVLSSYAWKLTLDARGVDMYGFDQCIEMLGALKPGFPNIGLAFSLPMVGEAGYFRDLKARIAAAGLEGHVLFINEPLDDVYLLWKASDVFVRATNTDGDAVAVREALSQRVPVVASDASARPAGAVLFEARNLDAMTRTVREVLTHRAAHVEALQAVSMDDNFPPILALYRSIASR
jgi:glycosyltransferase involved in cell wall biosynthesis